jgi:hypothetical protein|tara:strand:- start:273 stop:506 length:234 start_codon:yes stop_codon:yes gene_type:complete
VAVVEVKLHPVEQEVQVVVTVAVEQDLVQLVILLRLVHLKEIQVVILLLVPIKLWAVAAVLAVRVVMLKYLVQRQVV